MIKKKREKKKKDTSISHWEQPERTQERRGERGYKGERRFPTPSPPRKNTHGKG